METRSGRMRRRRDDDGERTRASEWTPETYGAVFGTLGTPESAGTIEEDEEYVSFVKALEREREEGGRRRRRRRGWNRRRRRRRGNRRRSWNTFGRNARRTSARRRAVGRKIEREKEIEIIEIQKEGKSTTRLDDEPAAADAAPKRKQKPKAKSKRNRHLRHRRRHRRRRRRRRRRQRS